MRSAVVLILGLSTHLQSGCDALRLKLSEKHEEMFYSATHQSNESPPFSPHASCFTFKGKKCMCDQPAEERACVSGLAFRPSPRPPLLFFSSSRGEIMLIVFSYSSDGGG